MVRMLVKCLNILTKNIIFEDAFSSELRLGDENLVP